MGSDQSTAATATLDHVSLAGLTFDRFSEADLVRYIVDESQAGRGGWVLPVNVDVYRQIRRDAVARKLAEGATLIVPDGMPLIWASYLSGAPFTERISGASLIFSLSAAAAETGRSIYLLGGASNVPEAAAETLEKRYPGLKVVGTDSPPFGFEKSSAQIAAIRERICRAAPDIVYVGMGFPKQERLIIQLTSALSSAWFVGCGAAIPFAAGTLNRAPLWMQRAGLEWTHRLFSEPRRLFRRYLIDDLPCATGLLISSAVTRVMRRSL